jgi:hypothetical protein
LEEVRVATASVTNDSAAADVMQDRTAGTRHRFFFPLRYFEVHGLLRDWSRFLDDFQRHWPTGVDHIYVNFVHDGVAGSGAKRTGNTRWRHPTARRSSSSIRRWLPPSSAFSNGPRAAMSLCMR